MRRPTTCIMGTGRRFAAARRRGTSASIGWWAYFTQFRPLVDGFASGEIYHESGFDAAAWRAKLREYPFLRSALHVASGDLE